MEVKQCCTSKALEGAEISVKINDYKNDESFVQHILCELELFKREVNQEWVDQLKWNTTKGETLPTDRYIEILDFAYQGMNIFIDYIKNKEDLTPLKAYAQKTAEESLLKNFSADDLMANMNNTKKQMISFFLQSTLNKDEQIEVIIMINDFFSYLLNYCTVEYITQKEKVVIEQQKFIQDMHMERLTILGQISASFVHEFRNPLTAIKGFIRLLQETGEYDDRKKHYFSVINHEMRKLQDVCSKFLLLSKSKQSLDEHPMVTFHLSSCVKGVIDFMYPRFSEDNIEVISQIEKNIHMFGVEEQLEQVILNIIINAAEELKKEEQKREIYVDLSMDKERITLQLANNGPAIPPHIIQNIFQPFVTTKEVGTGLGLAVCKQIVEKHRGEIEVASTTERTSFTIHFPIH